MVSVALVLARWVHFALLMTFFGAAIFAIMVEPGRTRARPVRTIMAGLALASGLIWVTCTLISITGGTDVLDPATLGAFFLGTSFGPPWLAHLGLCLALIIAAQFELGRVPKAVLAGVTLASLAWIGHASAVAPQFLAVRLAIQVIHLLAAGMWLGALPGLVRLLAEASTSRAASALRGFSTLGMVAVVLILATGLANTAFLLASPTDLYQSPYGRVLSVKVSLVALMIGLATLNRLRLTPRIQEHIDEGEAIALLIRTSRIEQGLGFAVLLAVSILGILPPPG